MCYGDVWEVAIDGPILQLGRVQMRNAQERLRRTPRCIPGEYAAICMSASNRGMICRDSDRGNWAGLYG